jgi:hypothetical protein
MAMRTLPLMEVDMSRRPGELPCARWSERSQSLVAACRSAAIDDPAVSTSFSVGIRNRLGGA